jgi:rod shape-determining protein MreC
MLVSVAFLSLEAFGPGVPRQIRSVANDIVAPILYMLEKPVRAVQGGLERLAGVGDIYVENQSLRAENERLLQWREAAMQLGRENDRLRQILKVPKREVPPAATARVIGVGGGTFERSVLVGAGSGDNVVRGFPVVDESGLLGRVIHVGRWTSRVLLITDLNSRVPVRVERTGALAIAEGQNEAFLRLRFLPRGANVRVGDRILTSGHGGAYPPDLPVARVSEITEGYIYLEPLGFLDKLDFVRIMAYQAVPDEDAILPLLEKDSSGG